MVAAAGRRRLPDERWRPWRSAPPAAAHARVMFVLPRWHTQRCGRCLNSRYLYGQRRALPLSSSTRSART
eukprot:scaffold40956_cov45-Phaeocystis_antarctica.AAC.2